MVQLGNKMLVIMLNQRKIIKETSYGAQYPGSMVDGKKSFSIQPLKVIRKTNSECNPIAYLITQTRGLTSNGNINLSHNYNEIEKVKK